MKINLSKEELIKLQRLFDVKEYNIIAGEMLNDLCCIRDKQMSKDFINGEWKKNQSNILLSWAIDLLGIDNTNKQNKKYISEYLENAFSFEDVTKYEKNPYKTRIKPENCKENKYRFSYECYPAYSFFPLNDISVNEDNYYKEDTHIGCFKSEYYFLTLFDNNEIWMCITPNEMNTMAKAIENANGHVITLGLGLGYFAYMCSLKDNIQKITIIEKDKQIIHLFTTYILPHFEKADKIRIINDNAFNQINTINNCDYCFVDLWHDANDGLPIYLELIKKINIQSDYWIEESLIALYRRCLITVIEESLSGKNDSYYKHYETEIDQIINDIYFKTKSISFTTYDEIHAFLSKSNIKKLISK